MTNGFEPRGGARLRVRLGLALVCCLIAAIGLTLAGPPQLSMPQMPAPLEFTPPPPPELAPEEPSLIGTGEVNEVSTTAKTVLLILFALLIIFLTVLAGRRAMGWMGDQMRRRETEIRLRSQRGEVSPSHQELLPAMERAISMGRGYLTGTGTSNDAIIAAWLALEAGAKEAGVPRDLAQTPTEFTVDVMHKVAANPAAVRELLGLYQIARFTDDHLDARARSRALDIMEVLAADFRAAAAGLNQPPAGSPNDPSSDQSNGADEVRA